MDAPSHSFDGIYLIKTSTALKSRPHSLTIKSLLFSSNKFSLSSVFNSWLISSIFQKIPTVFCGLWNDMVDICRLPFFHTLTTATNNRGCFHLYHPLCLFSTYTCFSIVFPLCQPGPARRFLPVKWKICPAVAWSGGQRVDHLDSNTLCINGGELNE